MCCATMQRKLPKAKLNFVYHKEWSLCLWLKIFAYLVSTTFVLSKKNMGSEIRRKKLISLHKKFRENGAINLALLFFMNVIYAEHMTITNT